MNNQAEICQKIFTKPICVISGNAGTVKTTVIRALLDTIERVHGIGTSFRLLAPTGKASERIKVQTGKDASTIHSFLASNGWLNDNLTMKRSGGKRAQDVNTIIVDECSMLDLNVFATLLRAINWNSVQRLILIGDPNQLPPIGRGKVFADVIDWLKKNFPENMGTLTDNVRQRVNQVTGNGCGILELADVFIQQKQKSGDTAALKLARDKIFEKILLHGNGDIDKDLAVYFWEDQDELEQCLLETIAADLNCTVSNVRAVWFETKGDNPEEIQVISPYRGEIYGTESLNMFMQENFKSFGLTKLLDGIGYTDKVIQIINRPRSNPAYAYDHKAHQAVRAEIYNGEIGIVGPHPLDKNKRTTSLKHFKVNFSGVTRKDLSYDYGSGLGQFNGKWIPEQKVEENLELAYAISVHKSQGSEFDYVYIVLPKRDSHLLSMELLYTALTRAQKKVTVLLQDDISTLATMSRVDKS
ncbi:MAG: AAA family ATPase, partial [Selenomonadaceae bacterium]|nr:AAA family ATPase [Selenomonadaceae bacterium]